MTSTDLEKYRKILQALLRRIGDQDSRLRDEALREVGGEASGGISNVPVHPADLAGHQLEEQIALKLLETETGIVEEIRAAWERLEKGTFGQCEACRQEIPRDRLQSLPYARYCVACARKLQGS